MKIVVTGLRGFPDIQGGIETHCEELYPRIASRGVDVTVVRRTCFVKENPPLTEYKGVKFKDINTPKIIGLEAALHTLVSVFYAKRVHADIIHIHAVGPSIVVPVAKLLRLKVVVTHHGPDYDRKKWGRFAKFILKSGERFTAKYADRIIVISTVIRDILKNKYNRTQGVELIYNGVNVYPRATSTDFLQSLHIHPGRYIVAVGRFVEEKNFDQLITAYEQLKKQTDCQLVLVGDADIETAYSKNIKHTAKEKGVILTGIVKGEKLKELYSYAALFVLPSSHEGLPITLLEAMSYDRKVVVSDIPANLAVNLPTECYFHCNDLKDMQEKIERQLNLPTKDYHYDLTPYNWDHIADQTISVYRSV